MAFETTTNDTLLAVRCKLGEADALDELVDRRHAQLSAYVSRLLAGTGNVDEAIQDMWLRILRGLPKLKEPSKLVPWMYRIARLAAMDVLRRRYAARTDPLEAETLPADGDDELLPLRIQELEAALAQLALPEREVVVLYYFEEQPVQDIAEWLGIPPGTVKSRLFRARRQLKNIMDPA